MNQRPKLLFLAYTFPPIQTSACTRTWNTAKYLSRLGWEVTVVTPDPFLFPVLDNPELAEATRRDARVHRVLTGHGWRIFLRNQRKGVFRSLLTRASRSICWHLDIEPSVGWLKPVNAACRSLTSEDVDVILATGPPFVAFRAAAQLARRLQRPYVLDYRDPWTGNPHRGRRPCLLKVKQERKLLNASAAVTIVSRSWRSALERRFDVGSKLHVVTNGYDPEDLADVQPHDFGHFAVVYTGIFYPPKRAITPVMAALQLLEKRTPRDVCSFRFHYYGPHGNHIRHEAERFAVMDRVILHGTVSRAEALAATRGADVAVVITSTADTVKEEDMGIVTGKVFDSLGLGTPILLISPPGSDARDLASDKCMARSFTGSDVTGIAHFLLERMQKTLRNTGSLNASYSWPVLARKLDTILKQVSGSCPATANSDNT